MEAQMSNNRPEGFYIKNKRHLVPPIGYDNINDGLDALETVLAVDPEDANSQVIAVPERGVSPWIFQIPRPNEAVKVEGDNSVLYFFWAMNEESGDQRIVMFDSHHESKEDDLWRIVTSEEWRRPKLGSEAFRLFENADAAMAACPDGMLITALHHNHWKGIIVHSARIDDDDIFYCTNSNLLAALDMPDGIPLNWEEWARASDGTSHSQLLLKNVIPGWTTNLKEDEIGPVVIRMIATEYGGICVLVRDDDGDNECGTRFLRRKTGHEQGKLLFKLNG